MPRSFKAVLDDTVGFAEEALVSIEAGDFPERELHYLRQRLLDALALFERDAGIEAAVADLYAAATALAIAQARGRPRPAPALRGRSCSRGRRG